MQLQLTTEQLEFEQHVLDMCHDRPASGRSMTFIGQPRDSVMVSGSKNESDYMSTRKWG